MSSKEFKFIFDSTNFYSDRALNFQLVDIAFNLAK